MNKEPAKLADKALAEVKGAYFDLHSDLPWEIVKTRRNLHFRCSVGVGREEAISILSQAIPHGYNNFAAHLLNHLPQDSKIYIAREGSVCLYVKGKLDPKIAKKMLADEFDYNPGTNESCLWFD